MPLRPPDASPARLRGAVRALWDRARRERSSPREVAWSFALGAFVGCSPLVGLHLWVALGLATLLRLNRLWAALGSRFSWTPVLLVTAFSEIQVAHRARTGAWLPLELRHALDHGRSVLLDWCLGTVPVGGFIALVGGVTVYAVALRTASRRATALPASPEAPPAENPPAGRLPP